MTMDKKYGSLYPKLEENQTNGGSKCACCKTFLTCCITVVICLGVGVFAGWALRVHTPLLKKDGKVLDQPYDFAKDIVSNISADNIRENLRRFTAYPHLGGTAGERRLADEIYNTWREQGLDYVTKNTYDVLLSFPNQTDPSTIQLVTGAGHVLFTSQTKEKPFTRQQNASDAAPPYNAYSATGDAQGSLIYVNFGTIEDFQRLRDEFNMSFTGSVCIARYGHVFRGAKALYAEQFGCSGLIMYTDPAEYASKDVPGYPESWWMPPTGAQRGNVWNYDGDPLTMGYPAIDSAYRIPEEDALLPHIPVHPISYGDAEILLREMGGVEAPSDWQGALPITYRLGPDLLNSSLSVKMHVTTYSARANTTNVIGYIEGAEEPDRYVLMGNHYDAWVFGAVDPNSGTAVMMEVSRAMATASRNGWRPRRTVVFCAWGSEEPGLMGSVEWVEDYVHTLRARGVAYLNMDMSVEGNYSMAVKGVPLLYKAAYHAAKQVAAPHDPEKSLYEEWYEKFPDYNRGVPSLEPIGGGSDHEPFLCFAGVSDVDIRYTSDPSLALSSHPLYHSVYETFDMVDKYMDPGFKISLAMGRYWTELILLLSDSTVLPFDVMEYATALESSIQQLIAVHGTLFSKHGLSFDGLQESSQQFSQAAFDFNMRLQDIDTTDPLLVRKINDQLMNLERAFISPENLPDRPPLFRHVIYAPSARDSYAGINFPGLTDLLFQIEEDVNAESRWEEVKRHLALIQYLIGLAEATLKPVSQFN